MMEKWEKNLYRICFALFGVLIIAMLLVNPYKSGVDNGGKSIIVVIIELLYIADAIVVMIPPGYELYNVIKNSGHIFKRGDDIVFEEIDKYKRNFSSNNETYLRLYKIMNAYYSRGGKVDKLVNNNEIERLLKRKAVLLEKDNTTDDYKSLISIITVLAASIISAFFPDGSAIQVTCSLLILILILVSVYSERGKEDSYNYLINEYELKCLNEKIDEFYNNIRITNKDVEEFNNKQFLLDEMKREWKKATGKHKKEIEEAIKTVENSELSLKESERPVLVDNDIKVEKLYETDYDGEESFKVK